MLPKSDLLVVARRRAYSKVERRRYELEGQVIGLFVGMAQHGTRNRIRDTYDRLKVTQVHSGHRPSLKKHPEIMLYIDCQVRVLSLPAQTGSFVMICNVQS